MSGGFIAWPALDVLEGRAVRLRQGLETEATDYGPALEAAGRWFAAGLDRLHVVDLGAAFGRKSCLPDLLPKLLALNPSAILQAAGGIRRADSAVALVEAGAARVVVGSLLYKNPAEAEALAERLGGARCVAALDAEGGTVLIAGWRERTGEPVEEACRRAMAMGYGECLVTDVARDGMGTGPNLPLYAGLASRGVPVIASGGIRDASDLAALASVPGLRGAVVGRALYEGTLRPADLLEVGP